MRRALLLALGSALSIAGGCHLVAGIEEGQAACPVDGVRNGLEIDVDCGGPCALCPDGARCDRHEDCSSNSCGPLQCSGPDCDTTYRCLVANCDDFRKNGTESDEDCGGTNTDCARCYGGEDCRVDDDCGAPQVEGKPTCVDGLCVSSCCWDDCQPECGCPANDPDCCDFCPPGGLGSQCDYEEGLLCDAPLSCMEFDDEEAPRCY